MTAPARCPLCGAGEHVVVATVRWADVRAALARYVGRPVPGQLREVPVAGSVRLRRCLRCGLEHAGPARAGSAGFYGYLSSAAGYYDDDRWDFEVARSLIAPGERVADLGCGGGRFLASLPEDPRPVGVDPNPAAVRTARDRGVEVVEGSPADLAALRPGGFDVVTAFQALEHLEDVSSLVLPGIELLRPGGRLVVSVPNRQRLPVNEVAVLDWPPHHLSRWAPEQFARLAEAFGLELVEVRCERRGPAGVARLLAYLAVAGLRGRDPVSVLPGQPRPRWTWSSLSRRHSMLAVLRRPGPVTPTTAPATPGT